MTHELLHPLTPPVPEPLTSPAEPLGEARPGFWGVLRRPFVLDLRALALLRIAQGLGGGWQLAAVGHVLPRSWRDALYRFVARHRYRWFGRQESCLLPTPALKARFL